MSPILLDNYWLDIYGNVFVQKWIFNPQYSWDWGISLSIYGIPGVRRPLQEGLVPPSHLDQKWLCWILNIYLRKGGFGKVYECIFHKKKKVAKWIPFTHGSHTGSSLLWLTSRPIFKRAVFSDSINFHLLFTF